MFKRVRCPIDNGKMTKRTCLSGPNAGREFYVCEHYRDGDPRLAGHKIPIEKHNKSNSCTTSTKWRMRRILRFLKKNNPIRIIFVIISPLSFI